MLKLNRTKKAIIILLCLLVASVALFPAALAAASTLEEAIAEAQDLLDNTIVSTTGWGDGIDDGVYYTTRANAGLLADALEAAEEFIDRGGTDDGTELEKLNAAIKAFLDGRGKNNTDLDDYMEEARFFIEMVGENTGQTLLDALNKAEPGEYYATDGQMAAIISALNAALEAEQAGENTDEELDALLTALYGEDEDGPFPYRAPQKKPSVLDEAIAAYEAFMDEYDGVGSIGYYWAMPEHEKAMDDALYPAYEIRDDGIAANDAAAAVVFTAVFETFKANCILFDPMPALLDAIHEAEALLASTVPSEDGENVEAGKFWIDQDDIDELAGAVQGAKDAIQAEDLSLMVEAYEALKAPEYGLISGFINWRMYKPIEGFTPDDAYNAKINEIEAFIGQHYQELSSSGQELLNEMVDAEAERLAEKASDLNMPESERISDIMGYSVESSFGKSLCFEIAQRNIWDAEKALGLPDPEDCTSESESEYRDTVNSVWRNRAESMSFEQLKAITYEKALEMASEWNCLELQADFDAAVKEKTDYLSGILDTYAQDDYTAASYGALLDEIAWVNAFIDDGAMWIADVENVDLSYVEAAIAALVFKPAVALPRAKTQKYAEINALDDELIQADYTPESWATLQAAIQTALSEVAALGDVTAVESYDYSAVQAAIAALKKPEPPPSETPTETPPAETPPTETPPTETTAETPPTQTPSPLPSDTPEIPDGWANEGGKWYYYEDGEKIISDWLEHEDDWYYLDDQGGMHTGWLEEPDGWYYLKPDGTMATGIQKVDGKYERFGASGVWTPSSGNTGWVNTGSGWTFTIGGSGATGWEEIEGDWYYFNTAGTMQTGWEQVGGSWYFLEASGKMATGWKQTGGSWYYLNTSGAMASDKWVRDGSSWYYLGSGGVMRTGWIRDNGTWYYLRESGAMATGWLSLGGEWYYLKGSGAMATGWTHDGKAWYYLHNNGTMAENEWVQTGGAWYWLKPGGKMAENETVSIAGKDYIFGAGGAWVN